ncbi:MAG: esterase [Flavobacteriaceae bacterium]|nr:esterase [Flavobacteriaceae bacterium]
MTSEKQVSYLTKNSYSTLNSFGDQTKNVWMVFHGMGYLSRYFLRYFSALDPEKNYILAPQAPSKYYLSSEYKHVGASWLTRENTQAETENIFQYLDAVWKEEKRNSDHKLILFGYSQGVSIVTRWMASRNMGCDHLVLHSGGIPKELQPDSFNYLQKEVNVTYLYGNQDPHITEARKIVELQKGTQLFGERLKVVEFKGGHEVYIPFLKELSDDNY